jgi:chromosome segregation ATPase
MNDNEGYMSTFLLASQVSQRLSVNNKKGNGITRSALLTQVAGQLQHFHNIQLSWDEQWHVGLDSVTKADEERMRYHARMDEIRRETWHITQAHQQRLGDACREMCSRVDEQRMQEHDYQEKLARSQHRLTEQSALVSHLEAQQNGLKASLDKTHHKFNEVFDQFQRMRDEAEHRRFPMNDLSEPLPLANDPLTVQSAQPRAQSLGNELEQDRAQLLEMKSYLTRLKVDMATETSHASKLEDFVRRIAEGPSTSIRCGGGFILDSTAKREAIGLLNEAAQVRG